MERRHFIGLVLGATIAAGLTKETHAGSWHVSVECSTGPKGPWKDTSYHEMNGRFMSGYLKLNEDDFHHTVEFKPEVMADISKDNKIIGVECLNKKDFDHFKNLDSYEVNWLEMRCRSGN